MSAPLPPPPPPPRPDVPVEADTGKLPPAPWRALEAFPVVLVALVLDALLGLLVAKGTGCDLRHAGPSCGVAFVLTTSVGEISFLVVVLFWVKVVDRAPLRLLGFPRKPLRDVAAGVAGGLGLVLVGGIASVVVLAIASLILGHRPVQPDQIPTYVRHGSLMWSGVVVVVAAPLGEETLFRGFLYRGLRRRLRVWPAALISAALFALVHGFPILIFALFPVGIGLALVYEWRQSLLASMTAHGVFNLIGILLIAASRR